MNRKITAVILSISLAIGTAIAGSPQFDIECGGVTAKEGYYLVKVWVHSNKKAPDDMAIREAAVRGVLFRGVAPAEGCQSLRPIAGSQTSEDQHADYFNAFFNTEKKIPLLRIHNLRQLRNRETQKEELPDRSQSYGSQRPVTARPRECRNNTRIINRILKNIPT